MRITNQELITADNGVQEAKLEVYIPADLLSSKTTSMGAEVAAVYVGGLFVNELKEALAKLNPPE